MVASLYAHVDNTDERRVIDLDNVPVHKRALWKPVVFVGKDATFNPATQVKVGPVTTVTPTEVVDTWTVRNKTQEELAATDVELSSRIDDAIANVTGKVLFKMANSIRTLQGQAPFTPAQFRDWFKAQQ